ncbi:TPA: ATP-binding cassette domain-containing protein [Clostridioides difficile]
MNIRTFSKKYLVKYKLTILGTFLLALIVWTSNIGITYITGQYIDSLISNISIKSIYTFSIILFVLSLLRILIGFLNNILFSKLQVNMAFNVNFDILQHVKKLPIKFFKNIDSVYLNQRINSDSNTIVNFLISLFTQLMIQIICSLIVLSILFTKNLTFTFIIIVSLPIYLILYFIFDKKLYKTNLIFKEKQNSLFSSMHKQLKSISYIKLNSLFDSLDNELLKGYPKFFNALINYIKCSYCFESIESVISSLFNIILFFYGGILIYNKKLTIGDFIIIKSYYEILLQSVIYFTGILKSYPDAKVSYNRIFEILDTKLESNGDIRLNDIDSIELKNIAIEFDGRNIINNFNYMFEKGNVYLIKGNNGSGKSTLVKLLLGLYIEEFKGDVIYNNTNIKDIDMYYVRQKLISIMDQEPLLLHSDFYKNITQNLNEVDNKTSELIDNMINDINLKLNKNNESGTILNSNNDFSGGEKQKIALIRAIAKDPDIIVMDEPTSALDRETTNFLIEKIKTLKKNKIILIVSHDEKLNCLADKVIHIEIQDKIESINMNYSP